MASVCGETGVAHGLERVASGQFACQAVLRQSGGGVPAAFCGGFPIPGHGFRLILRGKQVTQHNLCSDKPSFRCLP